MNEHTVTNISASVLQRLYNRARERGDDYNLLLSRFAVERLLYRLSLSRHRGGFILKGAQLYALWGNADYRPTRDLDLLGSGEPQVSIMEDIFRTVADQPIAIADGISFDSASVHGEEIREDARYAGVRIMLAYHIGRARGSVQVDIGFGDAVSPAPNEVEFPTLLDQPAPRLKAYPPETVIAEKFEAMVTLGMANSRMKDFYDLYMLARTFPFDGQILRQALQATFDRRQTPLPTSIPLALSMEFAHDSTKQTQWNAFIRKSQLTNQAPALADVIDMLTKFVWPAAMAAQEQQDFAHSWDTKANAWIRIEE
jgi:hypothetical protein